MVTISTARVSCAATARGPPPNPFAVLTAPPASRSGISCSSRYPVYAPARHPAHVPGIQAPAAITPRQGRPVILACRVSGPATPAFRASGCLAVLWRPNTRSSACPAVSAAGPTQWWLAGRVPLKIAYLLMRWLFGLVVLVFRGDRAKDAE